MLNLAGKQGFPAACQFITEHLHGDVVPWFEISLLAIKELQRSTVDVHQTLVRSLNFHGQSRLEIRLQRFPPGYG